MFNFCNCDNPNCPVKQMSAADLLSIFGSSSPSTGGGLGGLFGAPTSADSGDSLSLEKIAFLSMLMGDDEEDSPSLEKLALLSMLMGGSADSPLSNESIEDFVKRKNVDENKAGFYLIERRENADGLILVYAKKTAYDSKPNVDSLDDSDVRKITIAASMTEAAKKLEFYTPGSQSPAVASSTRTAASTSPTRDCPCGRPDCPVGVRARAARTGSNSPTKAETSKPAPEPEQTEYQKITVEVNKILTPTFPEMLGNFDEYVARIDRQLREATPEKPALVPVMRGMSKDGGVAVQYVKQSVCDRRDLTQFQLMLSDTWTVTDPLSKAIELSKIDLYDFPYNSCESDDKLSVTVKTVTPDSTKTDSSSKDASETDAGADTADAATSILSSLMSALLGVPLSPEKSETKDETEMKSEGEKEDYSDMPPLVDSSETESEDETESEEEDDPEPTDDTAVAAAVADAE